MTDDRVRTEAATYTKGAVPPFLVLALSMAMGTAGCGAKTSADHGGTPSGAGGAAVASGAAGAGGVGGAGGGTGGSAGSRNNGGTGDGGLIQVEIATWWSGVWETQGLADVFDLYKKDHPDTGVTLVTFADAVQETSALQQRFTDGNPPGLFQANLGVEALTWGPVAQSLARNAVNWSQVFPAGVLDQVTYQDQPIAVPLALSRQNDAYWNFKVLNTLNLVKKIPETLTDLDAWLVEVSAAGYTHPLCFSGKDAWVSAHVLFNHVLPAVAGPQFSIDYWQGKKAADDPKLVAALEAMKRLLPYLSPDWLDLDMSAGINKLMLNESDKSSQCLLTPMGDWGGAILAESNAPDLDFVGTGWPGANLVTVFNGDVFVAARGASNQDAVAALVDTMASEAGQVAFSRQRGSAMPARKFTQVPATLDSLTQKNVADLSNPAGTAVPGYRAIAKRTYPVDRLSTATSEFFVSRDSAALLSFLKDNYSALK